MSAAQPVYAAETLGRWIAAQRVEDIPAAVRRAAADTLIDTVGLCVAARHSEYVQALVTAWPDRGACTVLGRSERREASAAALINGVAAHGEDFDNTFEGCPVHPGAVMVAAMLAGTEAFELGGAQMLRGIAVGQEVLCRLGLVAQKGVHAAGFHPTAVLGTLAATAGVAAMHDTAPATTARAFGIAGSLASGIIEYLADGSWTKRLHAGWAAHCGLRAVAMARAGFTGPISVFEGRHGVFASFAPSIEPALERLTDSLGSEWVSERLAFKPYACGTMTQPFIDCAIRLGRALRAEEISELVCSVGEGTVHRLWEPLLLKQRPPNGYAAKFSTPYCIAAGFIRGAAGLAEFTAESVRNRELLALAARVRYEIDPNDEYPRNYSGRIRAHLHDGRVVEEFQPYLRGGWHSPLDRAELVAKCEANFQYGGIDPQRCQQLATLADTLADTDVTPDIASLTNA
jgi:2-methylcitrate dehydratase PrpD